MLWFHLWRNIEGRLWGHPVTSLMTSSSWKYFFGIIRDDLFISEFKLKLCLIFQNNLNGRHFELAKFFLPEVIPEVECARKIAMSISDILSFWSTLWLKYWRRYINFKIWPILLPADVINDVMNMYLYDCSHKLMIPMHRKFNDDIFARFSVIMKNVVISFIKEYRGPTLRPPCDVIDEVIIMKIPIFA